MKGVEDVSVKESKVQLDFIKKLRDRYPGCWVEKADSGYRQGTPDWRFYYRRFWAAFEIKRSKHERFQPNQKEYVAKLDGMSFARTVYPENMEEVLEELDAAIKEAKT